MIITTTETISGYRIIQHMGVVCGHSVISKKAIDDLFAPAPTKMINHLRGSSLFSKAFDSERNAALQTMVESAESVSADAVVGLTITFEMMPGPKGKFVCAVIAYGTAVVTEAEGQLIDKIED